jgi:hypothetical protein
MSESEKIPGLERRWIRRLVACTGLLGLLMGTAACPFGMERDLIGGDAMLETDASGDQRDAGDMGSGPRINVGDRIDFPRVHVGTTDWQVYPVQNIGQAALNIDAIRVTGGGDFTISFPDGEADPADTGRDSANWKTTLGPEESFPIRVTFSPTHGDPQTGEIVFESNDEANPVYKVLLSGNRGAPCIEVTDEQGIHFGRSSVGVTRSRTITVTNCSRMVELRVDSISLIDDGGGVFRIRRDSLPGGLPDRPLVIPARETANFVLDYSPRHEEAHAGMLNIRSNDPARGDLNVPVTGRGYFGDCPVAVARGRISGMTQYEEIVLTQPLQQLQLTGQDSFANDGTPLTYEWSVISRPQGSQSLLQPNNTVAEPELWLDLAGTYEIELVVYDGSGVSSCLPAVVTVRAVGGEEIFIELTWKAEGVGEARSGRGTDLDLHYLHPLGQWDQAPYDVFWRNKLENWGAGENPSIAALVSDDLYGLGPEVISHSNPEPGLSYAVGVYYYADNGFGPADATVRIFIHGALQFELSDRRLPGTGHFLNVGVIRWPSGEVIPRNEVRFGFP